MYFRQKTLGRYAQAGVQPTQQPFTFPASVAGVDAQSSLMGMQPQSCLYTYNLMPSEYGMRLRKGYQEWARNLVEDPARGTGEVRTIIPFEAATQGVANDRLFAATDEGIWNATTYGTQAPTQEVTFASVDDDSGYGVFCEFTGDAADGDPARGHYLFYADGTNGLWYYTEDSGAWAQPIGGTDPGEWYYNDGTDDVAFPVDDICFIMVHKQRLWVILEDSDDAWYLPVGSIAGELKRFIFGSKLPHGGNLVGLWTWSIDGGDGVDDYLVAIGRGGDVVMYRGSDPELPDWSTTGTWFVGEMPDSRRVVGEYGPDLFILSTFGLSSLAELLQGAPFESATPSKRVNRYLRADVEAGKDRPEWQVTIHPADGFMQIITPKPASTSYLQYNMNLQTQAWGFWEDVPIICGATWNGDYFMGGLDGAVYINSGGRDGAELPDPNMWQNDPVVPPQPEWSTPEPGEYRVDGTQDTTTEYRITAVEPIVPGVEYEVFYKIKDYEGTGRHWLNIGPDQVIPDSVDDGVFYAIYKGTAEQTEIDITGSVGCIATFFDVTVRVRRESGEPIKWRTLTSFQAPQGHTNYSRVGLIRTVGIFAGEANLSTRALYDYNVNGILRQPPLMNTRAPGLWDSAIWDRDIWGYSLEGKNNLGGSLGMGRAFAILCVGNSTTRVNIVSWDLSLTAGGYL